MRTLFAMTISAAAILALGSVADAQSARKSKTDTEYTQQQRDQQACEERAKHEDRSGQYAGLPCWAREAFGRARNPATN